MLVIADTGPVNYLVLIGHVDILPALFGTVILPSAVRDELADIGSPPLVRDWITASPPWLDLRATPSGKPTTTLSGLDPGEAAAISLATELRADLLLMDDREGVRAARRQGLAVTGALGVLSVASERRLLDLADAFNLLKRTNFRFRQEIMDQLLDRSLGEN